MLTSHPIHAEGRFLGLAVHGAADWHVVAADPVIEDLPCMRFPTAEAACRTAESVLRRERRMSGLHAVTTAAGDLRMNAVALPRLLLQMLPARLAEGAGGIEDVAPVALVVL